MNSVIPGFTRTTMMLSSEHAIERVPRGTATPDSPLSATIARAPARAVSPDGTQTLALIAGEEPDSEVLLVARNGEAQRVLFCGTPCRWTHATWVDADRFVVAGFEEAFTETGEPACEEGAALCVQPVYYLFDLRGENVIRFTGAPKALEEMPPL